MRYIIVAINQDSGVTLATAYTPNNRPKAIARAAELSAMFPNSRGLVLDTFRKVRPDSMSLVVIHTWQPQPSPIVGELLGALLDMSGRISHG